MRLLAVIISLGLWIGCTVQPSETASKTIAGEVKYARHFKLVHHPDFTEIQLLQPENGSVERSFALVKSGMQVAVPAGMSEIQVPVKNMTVLSTTHIGMLDALDALGCVKGTTDAAFIANPTILKGIEAGTILGFTDETAITPERLLSKEISLVVFSGFGKDFPNADKLVKLGITTMANYDWREEHPLGKAEWIKVFGYLIDQPEKANAYFQQVEESYNGLKKALVNKGRRKSVLVGSLIGEIWYAPAGQSYMAHILKDAGADYIYKNERGTGSCEKTLEQVFKDQADVKIWINPGAVSIPDLITQQGKYELFTAVKAGQVYCYTHNSNYFWEMSAVNPHWILDDFAHILGGKSDGKLHFYQQLKN